MAILPNTTGDGAVRSLRVHLLTGLPTASIRCALEQAAEAVPTVPLADLSEAAAGEPDTIGVVLPPFAEPSSVAESWAECDFLAHRFGRPAHVASVSAFVDVDLADEHLASSCSLASRGWGQSRSDSRSLADILVGQIESATRLVLVGAAPPSEALTRRLRLLNPGAAHVAVGTGSTSDLGPDASPFQSVRVAPPWLEVLRGGADPALHPELFVYLRRRPFDAERLQEWLADPPGDLLRGKGNVWLAGEPVRSFGYSCAGSVHRLFPAGRWWASYAEGDWPRCGFERRRLLERWHPSIGDRRQEIVFLGVDLDVDRLCAGLDACLAGDEAVQEFVSRGASSANGARLQ